MISTCCVPGGVGGGMSTFSRLRHDGEVEEDNGEAEDEVQQRVLHVD